MLVPVVSPQRTFDAGEPIAPGDRRDDELRGLVEDLENRRPSHYARRISSLLEQSAAVPERRRLLELWSFAIYDLRTTETIVMDRPPEDLPPPAPREPWEKVFVAMARERLLVRRGSADDTSTHRELGPEYAIRFITINAATDKAEWRRLHFHLRDGCGQIAPHATRSLRRNCKRTFVAALERAYEYAATYAAGLRSKDAIWYVTDLHDEPLDMTIEGGSASAAFAFGALSAQHEGLRDDILVLGEVNAEARDVKGLGAGAITTKLGIIAQSSIDYVVVFDAEDRRAAESSRLSTSSALRVRTPTNQWRHPLGSIHRHCPPLRRWPPWLPPSAVAVTLLIGLSVSLLSTSEKLGPVGPSLELASRGLSAERLPNGEPPSAEDLGQTSADRAPSPPAPPDTHAPPAAEMLAPSKPPVPPARATTVTSPPGPTVRATGAAETERARARAHATLCSLLRTVDAVARSDHFEAYVATLPAYATEPQKHPCFRWRDSAPRRSFSDADRRKAAAACECP